MEMSLNYAQDVKVLEQARQGSFSPISPPIEKVVKRQQIELISSNTEDELKEKEKPQIWKGTNK